ncbi:unnamed protein product [Protopolystoma xenopodis]|uniref:Uncharacterized protein n=1 Tax=Protopolystoma xenopodis TaxID=117903 RepID=A0A3S5AZQ8_9PLAT|nr:unnamed protein product [Protopolystoma xenopodis]
MSFLNRLLLLYLLPFLAPPNFVFVHAASIVSYNGPSSSSPEFRPDALHPDTPNISSSPLILPSSTNSHPVLLTTRKSGVGRTLTDRSSLVTSFQVMRADNRQLLTQIRRDWLLNLLSNFSKLAIEAISVGGDANSGSAEDQSHSLMWKILMMLYSLFDIESPFAVDHYPSFSASLPGSESPGAADILQESKYHILFGWLEQCLKHRPMLEAQRTDNPIPKLEDSQQVVDIPDTANWVQKALDGRI